MNQQGHYGGHQMNKMQMPDPNYMQAGLSMGMDHSFGGFQHGLDGLPPNDSNMNYYQEYCRLFIANVVLTTQMKELIAEKNELLTKISELERRGGGLGGDKIKDLGSNTPDMNNTEKKTRIRRKATEVERHYKCPVTSCQKGYGSEGSLMQHIKLKHPEITDDPDWKLKLHKPDESEESPH